jgi:hypothetical protein
MESSLNVCSVETFENKSMWLVLDMSVILWLTSQFWFIKVSAQTMKDMLAFLILGGLNFIRYCGRCNNSNCYWTKHI